jgi:hypothetical protein
MLRELPASARLHAGDEGLDRGLERARPGIDSHQIRSRANAAHRRTGRFFASTWSRSSDAMILRLPARDERVARLDLPRASDAIMTRHAEHERIFLGREGLIHDREHRLL